MLVVEGRSGGGGRVMNEIKLINGIGLIKKAWIVTTTASIHRVDDRQNSQDRDLLEFAH